MGLSVCPVSRPPALPNCFVAVKTFNCETPPKEPTHQPPLFLNLVLNISLSAPVFISTQSQFYLEIF